VVQSSSVVVPGFVLVGAGLAGTTDGRVGTGLEFAVDAFDAVDAVDAANTVLAETGEAAAANFGSARSEVSLT
jgi:hypothetical protein